METHCYLCHNPTASKNEGRIAPPMVAIKARYIDREGYNKEEFIKHFTSFVENPTEEKALLRGAVKRHGVMPKQVFPEGSVAKIAAFMYDYQIEEPTWFKAHWESHGNKNWKQSGAKLATASIEKTFSEIGLEYALETKKLLGKNLMGAIQKEGTLAALKFCNIQAMPLTDSMSAQYNAVIKRVSDRNRNPNNKANAEELYYIDYYKNQLAHQQEIKPVTLEKSGKIQFYYPIETNSMCLQCHGTQIKSEVSKQILKLYPNDLAVGYKENEVRGIWSITFDKK
jgi:cytochrome c553